MHMCMCFGPEGGSGCHENEWEKAEIPPSHTDALNLLLLCERCERRSDLYCSSVSALCLSGHETRVGIGECSAMETFLEYPSMVSRERLRSLQEPAEPYG